MKPITTAGAAATSAVVAAALLTVTAPAAHAATTLLVPSRYHTIGAAINAAHNGDTVLVSPGTYRENISIVGKNITVRAASSNPASTVIAGNPGRTPVMIQHVSSAMTLRGFRIVSGSAPGGQGGGITIANGASPVIAYNQILNNRSSDGGGILVYNQSNPDIAYNTIQNNTATSYGGGVFAYIASSPTLHNNVITGNHANGGGGIYLESNSANRAARAGGNITLNTISNNVAGGAGGGIMLRTGEIAQITHNTITGNRAPYGGGIHVETNGSGPLIAGNTIQSNVAAATTAGSGSGGGISVFGQSTPTIQSNTLYLNRSTIYGGGIVLAESSDSSVVGNYLEANTVTNASTGTGGGIFTGNSNAKIWNNIFRSNSARTGGGLSFQGTGSWVVLNNTLVSNSATGTDSGAHGGGMVVGGKTTGKTSIVNNIFTNNNDFQIFDLGKLSTYDNNFVTNSSRGAFFSYGTGAVSDIRSINGSSRVAQASGNIVGTLGFVNFTAHNYALTRSSSAINVARPAGAPSNDYRGARRPYGGSYDIGAYEYTG